MLLVQDSTATVCDNATTLLSYAELGIGFFAGETYSAPTILTLCQAAIFPQLWKDRLVQ